LVGAPEQCRTGPVAAHACSSTPPAIATPGSSSWLNGLLLLLLLHWLPVVSFIPAVVLRVCSSICSWSSSWSYRLLLVVLNILTGARLWLLRLLLLWRSK
jgi:hypothetical protein